MKQIKTIANRRTTEFDQRVNEALADGWQLVKRYCYAPSDPDFYFVAELEKEDEPETPYYKSSEHLCITCAHREKRGSEAPCRYCLLAIGKPLWEPKA